MHFTVPTPPSLAGPKVAAKCLVLDLMVGISRDKTNLSKTNASVNNYLRRVTQLTSVLCLFSDYMPLKY